ncbi:fasciclin domain-containing protein [Eudoraea adriatica]|uniref:fasciclin domain-containing protein n=1 Tax=Eudoraea adriatica TaxID=446681 RepID=UPI0003783DAB|nr:fasciclin domain-containing protein [Eudoraea adriatica]
MKTKTKLRLIAGSFFVLTLLVGCKNEAKTNTSTATQPEQLSKESGQAFIEDDGSTPNVLQIAIGSPDHTTLVAAVQAANLENALVNAGPLMVFAPTNEAFDALPEGTVENLLKPENKDALANILKYHVTPGNYSKDFLKKFKKLGQANDQDVMIVVEGDEVLVGGAKILGSVKAGNGIVHVVDKVMLPPEE